VVICRSCVLHAEPVAVRRVVCQRCDGWTVLPMLSPPFAAASQGSVLCVAALASTCCWLCRLMLAVTACTVQVACAPLLHIFLRRVWAGAVVSMLNAQSVVLLLQPDRPLCVRPDHRRATPDHAGRVTCAALRVAWCSIRQFVARELAAHWQ
jgi:hypothetical protein